MGRWKGVVCKARRERGRRGKSARLVGRGSKRVQEEDGRSGMERGRQRGK